MNNFMLINSTAWLKWRNSLKAKIKLTQEEIDNLSNGEFQGLIPKNKIEFEGLISKNMYGT